MSSPSPIQVGVLVDIVWPRNKIIEVAAATEEYGFDHLWISDRPLGRDPFLVLHELSEFVREARLGLGTINASARHPSVLAASSAELNYATGGRFYLGLGSSITPLLAPMGLPEEKPVARTKEALQVIRNLLTRSDAAFHGTVFQTQAGAILEFDEVAPLPLLFGTSGGPRMLEAAGEVADGIIVPAGTVSFYESCLSQFRNARPAEGSSSAFNVVNGVLLVGQDEAAVRDAARPHVADAIKHRAENPHSLRSLGVSLEQAHEWYGDPERLPDWVLDEAAIAGSPLSCVRGLQRLQAIGVTQYTMRFPEVDMVRAVGEKVLPLLRAQDERS